MSTDTRTTAEVCCVCRSGEVAYRNYKDQPFCAACADGRLTPDREQEIRERRAAIADDPWGSSRDLDGQYTVQADARINVADGFASSGDVARISGDTETDRYRRADFIARAPRDVDVLLAEIDRLRGDLQKEKAEREADRRTWRHDLGNLREAREDRDELKQRLHNAGMTRTWTNEDGKKFVFVEDIAPHLLGSTKGGDR